MSLLKFILIFIVVSWILRILFRLLVMKLVKKATNFSPQQDEPHYRKPEGSVHVDFVPPKKKFAKDPGGDFVDYEELK